MRHAELQRGPAPCIWMAISPKVLWFCVLAVWAVPSLSQAQEYAALLQVSGGLEQRSAGATFRLNISYDSGLLASSPQALLIYAEPSHSLLLAHSNPAMHDPEDYREALALMKGPAASFRHSISLPFHPFMDKRIVIVTRGADGEEWLLADAVVNLRSFSFTTSFSSTDEFGEPTANAKLTHCCRGPRCSQMCVECDGPEFTCDLIECDIECGHGDGTWPPKV